MLVDCDDAKNQAIYGNGNTRQFGKMFSKTILGDVKKVLENRDYMSNLVETINKTQ